MKRKQKILKNVYNQINIQAVTLISLLVCLFVFLGCGTKKELVYPVTYEKETKKGEKDGAYIDSLKVEVLEKRSNGDYLLVYSIFGKITDEYWERGLTLKKVRLLEKNNNLSDKHIVLIPVQGYILGKAGAAPAPFHIRNQYLLKNNLDKPIRSILFSSGNKEYLLELL